MLDNFVLCGHTYERHHYTSKEIVIEVLPKLYGKITENLTYGQLAIITKMYNHGWNLLPTYIYDFKEGKEKLVANYKWFTLYCDESSVIHQYTSFVCDNGNVELYDSNEEICKFTSIDNMFLYMKHLDKTEPLKVSRYYNEKVVKNLEGFDIYGIDGEIYREYTKVFEDEINMNDITFELDDTKCHELIFNKADE